MVDTLEAISPDREQQQKGKKNSASKLFTDHLSMSSQASDFPSYGVDWSERGKSTSHCWWPYTCTNSSASHLCACSSCKTGKSSSNSSLIQCATCSLIVHATHLSESQEATTTGAHYVIPPCRPSFFDSTVTDDLDRYDRHCWSPAPALSSSCKRCKHKLSKRSPYDHTKRTSSTTDPPTIGVPENANSKPIIPLNGLVCLWCTRSYHWHCWEGLIDDDKKTKCDYGKFSNIIVRPQWLHRTISPSLTFRAQMPVGLPTTDTSPAPVIFFINKLSGGQKGEQVYRTLVRLLNPRQVFLLDTDAIIVQALDIYSSIPNIRVCICGGDGTVAWIFNHLVDAFPSLRNPLACIVPLGTGNDMSRALGWGHHYKSSHLRSALLQALRAHPTVLDRWKIQIEALDGDASHPRESISRRHRLFSFIHRPKFIRDTNHPLYDHHNTPKNTFFFNYISFGLDAAFVFDYHTRRMRDPSKFTSPLKNKMLCINESRKYFNDFALGMAWDLSSYLRLFCDDQDMSESIRHCHSLVILNTRSFGSGTHPWGRTSTDSRENDDADSSSTDSIRTGYSSTNTYETNGTTTSVERFDAQDYGDRKIEVLGLNTTQMALIRMGFHGHRIAQCSHVRIELNHPMPVHMDGGPFYLAGSIAVNILHAGQLIVLRNGEK